MMQLKCIHLSTTLARDHHESKIPNEKFETWDQVWHMYMHKQQTKSDFFSLRDMENVVAFHQRREIIAKLNWVILHNYQGDHICENVERKKKFPYKFTKWIFTVQSWLVFFLTSDELSDWPAWCFLVNSGSAAGATAAVLENSIMLLPRPLVVTHDLGEDAAACRSIWLSCDLQLLASGDACRISSPAPPPCP